MSSTNKTTNYNLSQFVGTDVPSYLGDYNSDMSKIDKAIGDVANSQGSVEQSVVGLTAEVQGLTTQVSGVSTSVQQLQTSVAQIDSGYKQADTDLSQRITTNANNIQTNTTAIESINTTIGTENISEIGDGTIKGAIKKVDNGLNNLENYTINGSTVVNIQIDTEYVCPSDGYVRLSRSSDLEKSLALTINGVWIARISNKEDVFALNVKKGMTIKFVGSDTNGSLAYYH